MKNSSFEILIVFSPIFVADTKITFVYNFVAPLKILCLLTHTCFSYIIVSLTEVLALFKKEKGKYEEIGLRAHWQADNQGETSFSEFFLHKRN